VIAGVVVTVGTRGNVRPLHSDVLWPRPRPGPPASPALGAGIGWSPEVARYLSRPNDLAQLTAELADWLDIPQAEEAGTDGGDPLAL
jgi:hypothetical protein